MVRFSLRLPDHLHKDALVEATRQGISANQLFLYAISSTVANIKAEKFFEERRGKSDVGAYGRVLKKVKSRAPKSEDLL